MYCSKCGKQMKKSYGGLCQGCYNYFKSGGTENPIPEPGVIEYDKNGKVICHICGRAYKRLGSHVRESHGLTIKEYKEMFGLCSRSKTTEKYYSSMMSKKAFENNMDKQILDAGKYTRIKPGETKLRKGKRARLQEILNRKKGKINYGEY